MAKKKSLLQKTAKFFRKKENSLEEQAKTAEQPSKHETPNPKPQIHHTFKLRHTLRGHNAPVYRMSLSSDGRFLASPSQDETVRIWDVLSGELLRTLKHEASVICVAWSPDGQTITTGLGRYITPGKLVNIWNVENGEILPMIGENLSDESINRVAWSPRGKILSVISKKLPFHAFGTQNTVIRLYFC